MKRALIWFLLLWKRLLKKKGFLIVLALIPVSAFLLTLSAKEDNGFMNVSVAVEGEADAMASELVDRLLKEESQAFRYRLCKGKDEAVGMVTSGETDAAWIIPGELEYTVKEYAKDLKGEIISVYQREETVFLKLSREKIFCTLYPYVSYALYSDFTANEILPDKKLTEEELTEAYMIYDTDENLIDYTYKDAAAQKLESSNYVTAPLRGFCAILMLLCGLASTMYFLTDEKENTFSLLAATKRIWVMAAGNFAALFTAGIFVTLALVLSGIYTNVLTETLAMLAFVFCASGFCTLAGSIIRRLEIFGLMLPVLLVICLVFCPVFITLDLVPALCNPLPPYHYLRAIYNPQYSLYMLGFGILFLLVAYPIYITRRKQTA